MLSKAAIHLLPYLRPTHDVAAGQITLAMVGPSNDK
jgi:hypothetical protein